MSTNRPPVAMLTASDTQLLLPDNRVTLYSGQSYDPGRRGKIIKREYYQASGKGTVNFANQDDEIGTCEAVFPSLTGIYVIGVEVTDRVGQVNDEPAEIKVTVMKNETSTIYGASGPTIKDVPMLENIAGKPSVTRFAEFLSKWDGKGVPKLNDFLKADHTVFLNINEKPVGHDSQGNKIPNPFPKNLDKYKQQVEQVFQYYENNPYKSKLIMVCENEPTTKGFHSGPMSDYLAMLGQVFIPLCTEYGFNGADGGVHVATINGADLDNTTGEGRAVQVSQLLNGYAKIPNLYAVNIHTTNAGKDSYDIKSISKAVNKVKDETGHVSTSNEWHVEKTDTVQPLLDICTGWEESHVLHSVYITGTGDDIVLNDGMKLNKWGEAYKKFINENQ
jgi:hypothetical protein